MLHLLPSALSKKIVSCFSARRVFLGELIFFVLCAHVIIFGMFVLLSSWHYKQEQFSVSLGQTGLTYVLMPLQKKVSEKNMVHESGSNTKSKVINYETFQKQKIKKTKKSVLKQPVLQKSTLQKPVSLPKKEKSIPKKGTTAQIDPVVSMPNISESKTAFSKKASLVLQSLPKSKSLTKKKANITHAYTKKQKQSQKKAPSIDLSTLEITEVQSDQTIEIEVKADPVELQVVKLEEPLPVVVLPIEAVAEPLVLDHVEHEATSLHEEAENKILATETEDIDLDNVVFLGHEQLDNSIVASKLKQAVEQCWNPPVGIKQGTSCQMRVHVNQYGKADDVKIIQSSKILVYDSPARKALFAMSYPTEVWNKTITIALGV